MSENKTAKIGEDEFDLEPYNLNLTKRLTIPAAEEVLFVPFSCLDHGFVRLIDYMGGDARTTQAARVSYGKGTKQVSEERGLVRYLMRHRHTTPSEMTELTFHARMPIFVARQWIRHRTASVNEYSARYSIVKDHFYIPKLEDLATQSLANKQGRAEILSEDQGKKVQELLEKDASRSYKQYVDLLNENPLDPGKPVDLTKKGLTRELARMSLTLNAYTEWYWKTNMHNLFHFLGLRKDAHAQKEIRVYADAMGNITQKLAPYAYEAFEDYNLNALHLSRLDILAIKRISKGEPLGSTAESVFDNKRERAEFIEKFNKLYS